MPEARSIGEPADEADWRALVEQGLKGAQWSRLVGKTADGIPIEPLYRESNVRTASDEAGFPGAAPFVRGARDGAWVIRQVYEHSDPVRTNDEIIADLEGGVGAIELVIDPTGARGIAINSEHDLGVALANVITDIAPVSLDMAAPIWPPVVAGNLIGQLKGALGAGFAFNFDPIGALMRFGAPLPDIKDFTKHVAYVAEVTAARAIRIDARPVHEAGGTEAQEIATALCCGIEYLRWMDRELDVSDTVHLMGFAVSVGPDVLIDAAKLRALRLCWARVTEAAGVEPRTRAAYIHAFTSRRMMTRYDAWTNILRVTTAAFAAGIGGADAITTYPFTDALGLPTPFARRVARNTQNVLLEECRLGQVADPAGGAWFVESLTQELAAKAWTLMQEIEAKGGIVPSLQTAHLQALVREARTVRQRAIATRRETITGVTDFPLLGATLPEFETTEARVFRPALAEATERNAGLKTRAPLMSIRWAEPFEALRDSAEARIPRPAVFFANLATLAEFGPRAQFARNLFAAGGVDGIGVEAAHATMEALLDVFRASHAHVAVITGTDARYGEQAENCAQRLKASGAAWVIIAGKPGESEAMLRAAGVDQFIYAGVDVLAELETLHAALGLTP